jgi:hypothetical protein
MSNTKIVIDVFNSKGQHTVEYIINDTISNNDDIDVDEIFYNENDGSVYHKSKMNGADEEVIIDQFFSNMPNVVGETTKISIESLSDADLAMFNKLFMNNYEIPDCVEFKVSPSVNLDNLPKINKNTEKDICPICLEDLYNQPVSYISGNKPNVKYCNHKFHTKCINEYCSRNDNCVCPICRQPIDRDSIRQVAGRKRKQSRRKQSRRKQTRRKQTRHKQTRRKHSKKQK